MARAALGLFALVALAGCSDMSNQPKQKTWRPLVAPVAPPDATIEFRAADATAPTITLALLERGKARFGIFCAPCHGEDGAGKGMIVQRGFPPPPSYFIQRLRDAPPQHFYDVITKGFGAMYSYAARVPPEDRWAIAAYIRALQHSHESAAAAAPDASK